MAIKISGTTVIDDSRNLVNVLGLKTVGGQSILGSGDIVAGGGATGASTDEIFWENGQNVTASYTITAASNAGSFGPITVNAGVTVTIPTGSVWTIV